MNWKIDINNIGTGGFCPSYWKSDYPSYGNANMAGHIKDCDLTDPAILTQGRGVAIVDTTTTAIKGMSPFIVTADTTYGFGGTKVYSITATSTDAVHTVAGAAGEDVALYDGALFYAYDTDIGRYNFSDWDDDWWSETQTGVGVTQWYRPYSNGRTDNNWTNPTNAYKSDDTYAENAGASYEAQDYYDFNISLPPGAVIDGVEVSAEGYSPGGNAVGFHITKDGGSNYSNSGDLGKYENWYETDVTAYIGGAGELWGLTLSKAEVESSNFGVKINSSLDSNNRLLDQLRVRIYFTKELGSNPHQMVVAGTSGVLYIADGQYVAEWNGDIATFDAFDTTDTDSVIPSIQWNQNRLYIASNKPNVSGRKEGSVYIWDGNADSWESHIKLGGEAGALFAKDGITYVFYKKNYSQGVCTLGYIDGAQVIDLVNYKGSLPAFYQVSTYQDFIIWNDGTDIFAYGKGNTNARLFKIATGGSGGLVNPFGEPLVSVATDMKIFSGYSITAAWKSILYDVSGDGRESMIDKVKFNIEPMAANASCAWSLVNNAGTTKTSGTISYTANTTATHIEFQPRCRSDNLRLELDWSGGNATNPVKIKSVQILGHTLQ